MFENVLNKNYVFQLYFLLTKNSLSVDQGFPR